MFILQAKAGAFLAGESAKACSVLLGFVQGEQDMSILSAFTGMAGARLLLLLGMAGSSGLLYCGWHTRSDVTSLVAGWNLSEAEAT